MTAVVRFPEMPSRTMPLMSMKMIAAPITARAMVPRPPARLMPPSTTAASALISQPTPVSVPELFCRAA